MTHECICTCLLWTILRLAEGAWRQDVHMTGRDVQEEHIFCADIILYIFSVVFSIHPKTHVMVLSIDQLWQNILKTSLEIMSDVNLNQITYLVQRTWFDMYSYLFSIKNLFRKNYVFNGILNKEVKMKHQCRVYILLYLNCKRMLFVISRLG